MYHPDYLYVKEPKTLYGVTATRVFDFIRWMLKESLPSQFTARNGEDVFQFRPIQAPQDNCIRVETIWSHEKNGRVHYPTGRYLLTVWEFVVLPLKGDDVMMGVKTLGGLRDDSILGEGDDALEDTEEIVMMFTEHGDEFFQRVVDRFSYTKMTQFLDEPIEETEEKLRREADSLGIRVHRLKRWKEEIEYKKKKITNGQIAERVGEHKRSVDRDFQEMKKKGFYP